MSGSRCLLTAVVAVNLLLPCLASAARAATSQPTTAHARLAALDTAARAAGVAYKAGDHAGFLRLAQEMLELGPGVPGFLYNLACAQALAGRGDDAVATLGRLAATGLSFRLDADDDLASLRPRADYQALVAQLTAAGTATAGASEVAFELADRELTTEGVAWDPASGDIFVSAVHGRKILRVRHSAGAPPVISDFAANGKELLWGLLGIEVDAARRRLWACNSAMPFMVGGRADEPRRAELVAFDLGSGAVVGRAPIAGGEDGHSCDTLTVAVDGTVYATDPEAGAVWALAPGSVAPRALLAAGSLPSPQGLALAGDGTALYVADYGRGLFRVALPGGELAWLAAPAALALTGIDGLELDPRQTGHDRLLAIQNGIRPHRIVTVDLAADGARIDGGVVLAQNVAGWAEPTLATVAGDALLYVARSQWGHFDRQGQLVDREQLVAPAVYRLALPPVYQQAPSALGAEPQGTSLSQTSVLPDSKPSPKK
jgi:hypothetical protein